MAAEKENNALPSAVVADAPALPVLILLIALAGAAGALLRFMFGEIFSEQLMKFPWTTFAINVAGSALLGLLAAVVHSLPRTPGWVMPTLGTGFLGSFTTFSAVILAAVPELTGVSGLTHIPQIPPGAFEMVCFLIISMLMSSVAAGSGLVVGLAVFTKTTQDYLQPDAEGSHQ